jgi:hypothetical protein
MNTKLAELIKNLREQDNRITANPIFMVQSLNRNYGYDDGYGSGHIWLDRGDEIYDEDLIKELDRKDEEYEEIDSRYYKCYYRDEWINKQPFFTEAAAKEYIRVNGHNLCEPRIYVESGWRNDEWNFIREYFLSLGENNDM